MNSIKLNLIAASVLLLGACASKPSQPEPAKIVPPPQNITLNELNTAIDGGVAIQNEKGEEMLCRREAKTGSRLARETICMTKSEWTRVSEESQRQTKKNMRLGKIPQGN